MTRAMTGSNTLVIVNPAAGAGATHDLFRRMEHVLLDQLGDFEVVFSEGVGDAGRLVTRALRKGVSEILVAGGDGTLNEVVNGWFDKLGRPFKKDARLTLLPGGTGGDFRRCVGIETYQDSLAAMRSGRLLELDVGRVVFRELHSDAQETRQFLNIASIGLSSLVDQNVGRYSAIGGAAAYVLATAQSLLSWANPSVSINVEGKGGQWRYEGPIIAVAVANGTSFGGGLVIAPDADPADGLFHVTVLGDMRRRDLLRLAPVIFEGVHMGHSAVHSAVGGLVSIQGADSVVLEVDGEPVGRLPIELEVAPRSLPMRIP